MNHLYHIMESSFLSLTYRTPQTSRYYNGRQFHDTKILTWWYDMIHVSMKYRGNRHQKHRLVCINVDNYGQVISHDSPYPHRTALSIEHVSMLRLPTLPPEQQLVPNTVEPTSTASSPSSGCYPIDGNTLLWSFLKVPANKSIRLATNPLPSGLMLPPCTKMRSLLSPHPPTSPSPPKSLQDSCGCSCRCGCGFLSPNRLALNRTTKPLHSWDAC